MKFYFRPKTKVTCAFITELSYGSVANIRPNANDIFGTKAKNKTKKIHFRLKTKKAKITKQSIFGAENENEFRSAFSLLA